MKTLITTTLLFFAYIIHAQVQEGKASYYADKFEGRPTASGEKYRHNQLTAAHKTLPFGTIVRVTNTANDKTVEVRINDRGPYVEGRVIDLSKSAADKLGMLTQGIADVKIEIVDPGDGKGTKGGTVSPSLPIGEVQVEERELYEFSVERTNPKGYGIQIGTYRELANLVRFADNLRASYRKNTTIQVKVLNSVKVYTLIVGQFPKREKADAFKERVTRRYPDAFIVEFASLK